LAVEVNGHHVSDIAFNEENWSYVPLVTVTNGAQASNAIFAFDRDYAIKPDKIVSVLYIRDSSEPGGWRKKATWSSDPWAAVQTVSAMYSIPADEVHRWGVRPQQGSSGVPAVVTFQNYADGVFADDQFAPLTADPATHDVVVAALETTSYKSADVPAERAASGCGSSVKLDSVAGTAAAYAFSLDASTGAAAQFVNRGLIAGGCAGTVITPIRTKPMGPAGPWTPVVCWTDPFSVTTVCSQTRKQKFLRMRTCAYGSPTVYCDQWTIIDCEEENACIVPGFGPCVPPPAPVSPNIPLGPDDGEGTPQDGPGVGSCENQGWTGTNPRGCTCP